MHFENVTSESCFFFIGFDSKTIENKQYLKIDILDRKSNTTFSIYKTYTDDLYDYLTSIQDFENVDSKIYVVYKNGRLKFDFRAN